MEIIEQRKAGQQSGSGQEVEEEALPRHKGKVRAQQDVAGSLRTDRQNLRTAELEQLFKVCLYEICLAPGLCVLSSSQPCLGQNAAAGITIAVVGGLCMQSLQIDLSSVLQDPPFQGQLNGAAGAAPAGV